MSDWKKKMAATLSAGQTPTYYELEEALEGALQERAALAAKLIDMDRRIGMLVDAFLKRDINTLIAMLDTFIKQLGKTDAADITKSGDLH